MFRAIAAVLFLTAAPAQALDLDAPFPSIDGGDLALSDWRGQAVLVVNTASQCAFTKQYRGLQDLYDTYRDRLLENPLFRQLDVRTRIARFAYFLKSPRLIRLGWRIAPYVARFTRWADPNFDPTERPQFRLVDLAQPSSSA